MTTKEAIQLKIEDYEKRIERLRARLETIENIEAVQICPRCNTKNRHYDPVKDKWICAFC